jgi:hypothetical protein
MHASLLQLLALSGAASAQVAHMMRFACSQLTVERLDPLVNPGLVGTPHTHQIVGGNSFKPEMTPVEYDLVTKSTCTSCTFSEDFRYVYASLLLPERNV